MSVAYRLNNVRFGYVNKTALSIDQLIIPSQQICALIGANGSGKSTLLNILALLKSPVQGEVQVFGASANVADKKIKRHIAYLPQKPYLFRGSVIENLRMVLRFNGIDKDQYTGKIQQAIAELKIEPLAMLPAQQLSGGEMQKVALARAIMLNPQILLMDEPFSYLDQASQRALEQFIRQYVDKGHTVIFSTHDRQQGVNLASKVISLVDGKPVASSLINVFSGTANNGMFDTGNIQLKLPQNSAYVTHVSIEPEDVKLRKPSQTICNDNVFRGRIIAVEALDKNLRLTIDIKEKLYVHLPPQTWQHMPLTVDNEVEVVLPSENLLVINHAVC